MTSRPLDGIGNGMPMTASPTPLPPSTRIAVAAVRRVAS